MAGGSPEADASRVPRRRSPRWSAIAVLMGAATLFFGIIPGPLLDGRKPRRRWGLARAAAPHAPERQTFRYSGTQEPSSVRLKSWNSFGRLGAP